MQHQRARSRGFFGVARSATLGDVLSAGVVRNHGEYCSDPTVLGGDPGTSTFDILRTSQLSWIR